MAKPLSDTSQVPGVRYALTSDGTRLPIVDVTHPAFAVELLDEEAHRKWVSASVEGMERFGRLPRALRNILLWWLERNSILIRGLRGGARGGFVSGMNTYLMKLGPRMLDDAYCGRLDRKVAASMPTHSVRVRLQETASRLAEGLLAPLAEDRLAPLVFINIAGGPCMDSLNALLLINQKAPELLQGRRFEIVVFDLVDEGPLFGARALQELTATDGPLAGLSGSMRHVRYDWEKAEVLGHHLAALELDSKVTAVSSEGGLFNYGADQLVQANLAQLHRHSPPNVVLVGTLTPAEGPRPAFDAGIPLVPRTLSGFAELVASVGWRIRGHLDYGTTRVVDLRKG